MRRLAEKRFCFQHLGKRDFERMASNIITRKSQELRSLDTPMRRRGLFGALLGLLALDWAALDDILTGSEPGFFTEWLVLTASVPAIVVLVRELLRTRHSSR